MTLIIFLLILSVLVLVHEFGHYIAARKNGIRVEEFGLGLPPRVFGKKIGETVYSINALPFGGFVKLTGEDFEEDGTQGSENNSRESETTFSKDLETDPRSFMSKSAFQKFTVLVAGVTMNFILAVAIFYSYLALNGFKTYYMPLIYDYEFKYGNPSVIQTVILDVSKDSPAEKAGMQVGEAVVAMNDTPITNIFDLKDTNAKNVDNPIKITLLDLRDQSGKTTRDVTATPTVDEKGNAILGVYLGKAVSINYSQGINKWLAGFFHSYNVMAYSTSTLGKIVGLSIETKDIQPVSESVAGPVGIYNMVGNIIEYGGTKVLMTLLDYIGLMSLSLAFVNILPFPALDGGRIVFVLYEGILKRKVNPKTEAAIHRVGMLFLLGLIVLITIKDLFL